MKKCKFAGKLRIKAAANQATRFDIVAYTGGKLNVEGFDLPVVVDLKGLEASGHIPIPVKHDTSDEMILGQTDKGVNGIRNDGRQLCLAGRITADPDQSPVVKRVLTMAAKGHQWQASIGADLQETTDIAEGETVNVNGQSLTGPFVLATRSVLRETSVLGMGADKNTRVLLAQAKGASTMSFEDWVKSLGLDPATLTDEAKQVLMQQYAALEGSTDAGETEEPVEAEAADDETATDGEATDDPEKKPVAAKAKAKKTTVQAQLPKSFNAKATAAMQAANKAYADNLRRVERIQADFGKDTKLVATAIEKNWSYEKTEGEYYKRIARANVPAGHRTEGEGTGMLQALQGAMILRAGGRIDSPHYGGLMGVALGIPKWLRAGVNAEQRQRAMEAAWEFRDMSLVDMCRAACRIDGKEPTDKGHSGFIRAAVSGGSLADIFSTNIYAVMIDKLAEAGDTTQGWTREADAANFMTMDRIRLLKGSKLTRHARGGEADNATRSDLIESYKIARYSQQFSVDEQDIIDDRFQALKDIPDEMALACQRLRPDLVYSILMANGTLNATGVALFSASQPGSQSNLTSLSGSLSQATLQAAMAAMFNFLEGTTGLNIYPTHILVPMGLVGTAFNLLQGQNIAAGAGTTNSGDINPMYAIQSKFGTIEVVTDQRLTNGVVDPTTDTSYSGSATTWRLVSNKVPTIEVAYLRGSGRAPQVRQFQLDKGKWGMGWDVNLDIGAKALEWRGFFESRA